MKNRTLFLDYRSMKVVKTFLILLAFLGLSINGVSAQNAYIITKLGSSFSVIHNKRSIGSSNSTLQTKIDDIKTDAKGKDCTIQFGNGTNTLDLGSSTSSNITFDGGTTGKDWGKITLTGKVTGKTEGSNNPIIRVKYKVSVESKADITGTATGDYGITIYNSSTGTLTISGGTVLLNSKSGIAIYNQSTGTAIISGGIVKATGTNAEAISSSCRGKVIISGNAEITSSRTNEFMRGTIIIAADGESSDICLVIKGGKIENTAKNGNAISNFYTGAVNISGGTISVTAGTAVFSRYGRITISGGKISATTGAAVACSEGVTNIKGGITFAYGINDSDVIKGSYTRGGDAIIVAWDATPGTHDFSLRTHTYTAGTSNDIYKLPATAKAVWATQGSDNGISVKYNTNTGFIPVAGVYFGKTPTVPGKVVKK